MYATGVAISQETSPPRFRDLPCPDARANHESARTLKMTVVRAHVRVLRARVLPGRGALTASLAAATHGAESDRAQ